MQGIKEIFKVINLFIVMSRVFTLSLPLQASSEAAIPITQSLADLADLMRWLMLLRHTERATKDNQYPLPIIYFLFCFMNFVMVSHSSEKATKRWQTQQGFELVQRAEVQPSKLNGKCLSHHFKYETVKKKHWLTFWGIFPQKRANSHLSNMEYKNQFHL